MHIIYIYIRRWLICFIFIAREGGEWEWFLKRTNDQRGLCWAWAETHLCGFPTNHDLQPRNPQALHWVATVATVPSTVGGIEKGAIVEKLPNHNNYVHCLKVYYVYVDTVARWTLAILVLLNLDLIPSMGDLSPYCCWLRFSQNMSRPDCWKAYLTEPYGEIPTFTHFQPQKNGIVHDLWMVHDFYPLDGTCKPSNKSIFFYWMVPV